MSVQYSGFSDLEVRWIPRMKLVDCPVVERIPDLLLVL